MGKVLFFLGTYSCLVMLLFIVGIVISFNAELYRRFVEVLNPITPALSIGVLVAEGLCIFLILLSYLKDGYFDLEDRFWNIGKIQTFVVAILLFFSYIVSFMGPPN